MKKLSVIPLLLALCLALNSCFMILSTPIDPTLVSPEDLGTKKTFVKAGITLQLTEKFKEEESERGFDAYYTSPFCGVTVTKELFTSREGLTEQSPEEYMRDFLKSIGQTDIEPQNRDGLWFYVKYNDSSARCVYSYVYKGTDAFYIVQYILNTSDEAILKDTLHNWAKATLVA